MRTDEEIKANQAKYERMMDEAFGLAAKEEPDRPAHPFNPGPMPSVMPYDAVYSALTGDPEAMALFQENWNDTLKPMDSGPMPGGAFNQLRWYILRDLSRHHHARHKADFEDAKKFRTVQRVNALFRKLEQHDPLFGLTKDVMAFYVEGLPPSAQRALERVFTRCPHEALEFYREIRRTSEKVVHKRHARNQSVSSSN